MRDRITTEELPSRTQITLPLANHDDTESIRIFQSRVFKTTTHQADLSGDGGHARGICLGGGPGLVSLGIRAPTFTARACSGPAVETSGQIIRVVDGVDDGDGQCSNQGEYRPFVLVHDGA